MLVEDLHKPTKEKKERVQVHQVMVDPSWMDPLVLFLKEGILPNKKGEANKGLDIVGPFPKVVGNRKWLLVGTDYFTKWVEAEPLSNIRDLDTKKFVWKNIVTRYSTPAYLQGNGQTKAVNKVIVNGLKKRLDKTEGRWVEELPHVLWTYRTTSCRSIGEILFSMTYGTEVVTPLETGFPTLRTSMFTPDNNDRLLKRSLDLVDERREAAMVQLAYY
ncbi:uncharacterized protein LOC142644257 [Castanea sativa]|uniref:uncharacterized protein LOC142644257 n=1 Tax=Castanea sativa TaxID=21020 RepID=UPI003F64E63C